MTSVQPTALQAWLEDVLRDAGAASGTVHLERDGDLHLAGAVNIPPPVLERVHFVPRGKGMAGLAQTRREPVQTCNLQREESGSINPMAKLVNAQAAIAIPVLRQDGGVEGVVGFAFLEEGELAPERVAALVKSASTLLAPQ